MAKPQGAHWRKVGEIYNDAALLLLMDPCYLFEDGSKEPSYRPTWDEFLKEIKFETKRPVLAQVRDGGVCVETGGGDQSHSEVWARVMGGRVMELRVFFE